MIPYESELEVPHWFDIQAEIRNLTVTQPPLAAKPRRLPYVVMLTSGSDDGGKRATLAFSAACAAAALELDTFVFLVGDGSHWAYEGSADTIVQPGFPPLADLVQSFTELGGSIFICATCDGVCSVPGEDGSARRRQKAVQPLGLAAVLTHAVGGGSVTF